MIVKGVLLLLLCVALTATVQCAQIRAPHEDAPTNLRVTAAGASFLDVGNDVPAEATEDGTIGHDIAVRPNKETVGVAGVNYVDTSLRFQKFGVVSSWEAYVTGAGNITFQVWRAGVDGESYLLVGENNLAVKHGMQTLLVPYHEQIAFQAGDFVGWRFQSSKAVIPHDEGGEGQVRSSVSVDVALGTPMPMGGLTTKTFSIKANFKYWPQIKFKPGTMAYARAKLGHTVMFRPETSDPDHASFVDTSIKFDFPGTIKAWEIYGNKPDATLKLQVWRKHTDSEYELRGENTFTSKQGLQFFPVPDGEEIAFEPGDMIGWTYVGTGGVIGYSVGDSTGLVMWSTGESVAPTLAANVTFLEGDARTYAVQAIFEKTREAADASQSLVFGAGTQGARAGEAAHVTVVAVDAYGKNMTAVSDDVVLKLEPVGDEASGTVLTGSCHYRGEGHFDCKYQAERAGRYMLDVLIGSADVGASPFEVSVTPANAQAEKSSAAGAGLGEGVAGEPTTFYVETKDRFGNPTGVGGADVQVVIEGPALVPVDVGDAGNGTYIVSYTAKMAGVYRIDVTLDGAHVAGSPFADVAIASGKTAASKCVAVGDGVRKASAGEPAQFAIQAKDEYGNNELLEEGDRFDVSILGPAHVVPKLRLDAEKKQYVVDWQADKMGTYTIEVLLHGKPIASSPFEAEVTPGPIDVASCTASGKGTSRAHAGAPSSFTIQGRDRFANPVRVGGAVFDARLTNVKTSEWVPARVIDRKDGTYAVAYTCTELGTYEVSVAVDATRITGSPFRIACEAGKTSPFSAELFGGNVNETVAGKASFFYLQAKDAFGNHVNHGGDNFTVELRGPNRAEGVVPCAIRYVRAGYYRIDFTTKVAGAYAVAVRLDGLYVNAEMHVLTVHPADSYWPNSFAYGSGHNGSVAGRVAEFTVQVQDVYKNNRTWGGDQLHVQLNGPGNTKVTPTVRDNKDGTYTVSYNTTVAGKYYALLYGYVRSGRRWVSQYFKDAPWEMHVVPDTTDAMMTDPYGEGLVSATAGEQSLFHVQAMDRWANFRHVGGDAINVRLTGPGTCGSAVNYTSNGLYKVAYSCKTAGKYFLFVEVGASPLRGSPFNVTVMPNAISPAHTVAAGVPAQVDVATDVEFWLDARDAFDNQLQSGGASIGLIFRRADGAHFAGAVKDYNNGSYALHVNSRLAGAFDVDVLAMGEHVVGSPYKLYIRPGASKTDACTAEGAGVTSVAAGELATFVIADRDQYGNLRDEGATAFAVAVASARGGVPPLNNTIIDYDNGTYAVSYRPVLAGDYMVAVRDAAGADIKGSPYRMKVRPGELSAANSWMSGTGMWGGVAGHTASFVIHTKDTLGNVMESGGGAWDARLMGADTVVNATVTDKGDGSYDVSYVATRAGTYFLHVRLGDRDLSNSPIDNVTITPDVFTDPTNCTLGGDSFPTHRAGHPGELRLVARDQWGNVRPDKDDEFAVTLHAEKTARGAIDVPVRMENNGDGTWSAFFDAELAGNYSVHVLLNGGELPASVYPGYFMEVTAGDTFANASRADGAGLEHILNVDDKQSFTVFATDRYGNAVPHGGDNFEVIITGPANYQPVGKLVDNEDGTYEVTYTLHQSGKYYVYVMVDNRNIAGSPWVVHGDAGASNATHSTADGDELRTSVAGREAHIALHSEDDHDNIRKKGGDAYEVTVTGEGSVVAARVEDHGDGNYTATFTPRKAGEYLVHIKLNGVPLRGSPFAHTVQPGPIEPARCQVLGAGITYASVNVETTATIWTKDGEGNFAHRGGERFVAYLDGPENVLANVTDRGDGSYRIAYTVNVGGAYKLHVTTDPADADAPKLPIGTSPFNVFVDAHPTSPHLSYANGTALLRPLAAGEAASFVIHATGSDGKPRTVGGDAFRVVASGPEESEGSLLDQLDGTYVATVEPHTAGHYNVSVTLNGHPILGSPFCIDVVPGAVSVEKTTAAFPADTRAHTAGTQQYLTITSRDKYGNVLPHGGLQWTVLLHPTKHADGSSAAGAGADTWCISDRVSALEREALYMTVGGEEAKCMVDATRYVDIVDLKDGLYAVNYTAPYKMGDYSVTVALRGRDIAGSPFHTEALPDVMDAGASGAEPTTLAMNGTRIARVVTEPLVALDAPRVNATVAGVQGVVVVRGRDHFGNLEVAGGADVRVEVEPASAAGDVDVRVQDMGTGEYRIFYHTRVAGEYALRVYVHGELLNGRALRWTVHPDVSAPSHSAMKLESAIAARHEMAGEEMRWVVDLADQFGNEQTREVDTTDVYMVHRMNGPANAVVRRECKLSEESVGRFIVACETPFTGAHEVVVRVNGADVRGSPHALDVQPGVASAEHCEVRGGAADGFGAVLAGVQNAALVTVRDRFGHRRRVGGDDVRIALVDGASGASEPLEFVAVDRHDGSYNVTYTPYHVGTARKLVLHVNGEAGVTVPLDVHTPTRPVVNKMLTAEFLKTHATHATPSEYDAESGVLSVSTGEHYAHKLWSYPVIAAGHLSDELRYTVELTASFVGAGRPVVGVTDGKHVVGLQRADGSEPHHWYAVSGRDGARLNQTRKAASGASTARQQRMRAVMRLGAACTSLVVTGQPTVAPATMLAGSEHGCAARLDVTRGLSVVAFGAHAHERVHFTDVEIKVTRESAFSRVFDGQQLARELGATTKAASLAASGALHVEGAAVETGRVAFEVPLLPDGSLDTDVPTLVRIRATVEGSAPLLGVSDGRAVVGFQRLGGATDMVGISSSGALSADGVFTQAHAVVGARSHKRYITYTQDVLLDADATYQLVRTGAVAAPSALVANTTLSRSSGLSLVAIAAAGDASFDVVALEVHILTERVSAARGEFARALPAGKLPGASMIPYAVQHEAQPTWLRLDTNARYQRSLTSNLVPAGFYSPNATVVVRIEASAVELTDASFPLIGLTDGEKFVGVTNGQQVTEGLVNIVLERANSHPDKVELAHHKRNVEIYMRLAPDGTTVVGRSGATTPSVVWKAPATLSRSSELRLVVYGNADESVALYNLSVQMQEEV